MWPLKLALLLALLSVGCIAGAGSVRDFCIVGAGPAGLQLAYFLHNHADYIVIERNARAGSFFERFPIHRRLISLNKQFTASSNPEFNLRHDW